MYKYLYILIYYLLLNMWVIKVNMLRDSDIGIVWNICYMLICDIWFKYKWKWCGLCLCFGF